MPGNRDHFGARADAGETIQTAASHEVAAGTYLSVRTRLRIWYADCDRGRDHGLFREEIAARHEETRGMGLYRLTWTASPDAVAAVYGGCIARVPGGQYLEC
jgi:hypothetical protein